MVLVLGGLTALPPLSFVFTNMGLPLVVPNATALALSPYGREAGTASAFLGVLQFTIGGRWRHRWPASSVRRPSSRWRSGC
jgi:DHA1 family bicyclomycin/chloramphenicol resistance-like MFS transporter